MVAPARMATVQARFLPYERGAHEGRGSPPGNYSRESADDTGVDADGETIIICTMRRRYQRVWAILLALVLSLFPLEGALATPVAYSDASPVSGHGTPHTQDSASSGHTAQMAHDCEYCSGDECGMNSGCSSVHCAACALAILSPLMLAQISGADVRSDAREQEAARDVSSPFFRPPRG